MALISHVEILSRLADGSDAEETAAELCRLLCKTVQIFEPGERISIVIDRLDMCEESERSDMLRLLVDLLNETRCFVKILVVIRDVCDWEPNCNELRRRLRSPGAVQQISRVQGVRGFTY